MTAPRGLPFLQRRVAEEAVRRGLVAAVVMEAAAREWASEEGPEGFPDHLVRRGLLTAERRKELEEAVAGEAEPAAAGEGAPGEEPRAPHPSEVVRGYRILERLGRGGMGSVYRAEQLGMDRIVALKILRRPLGLEEQHVERLRREARLVGGLDHPNIVRGLDVGQHGPYHYFAMEFVEGETLRDLLRRRGALPEAEALRIVEQVCLALDHAHSREVIHRDVKPGNIIVTPDGTPKLTDYGLAKGPSDFSLTQSGVTIGTPQYISPEQARDPSRVDIQTDIYSLGATAYHMLTGIPPHASETLAGLLTKVLYEKPRTSRQANPRVSPGASFLVEKMMAKQKRHRYRTPREVLRDLRSLAAGRSIVPRNWEGDFEVHEVRRRSRILLGAGTLALAVLAGVVVLLQHRVRQEERRRREEAAEQALVEITRSRPRDRAGLEALRDSLDAFLRGPHAGSPSRGAAEAELENALKFLEAWDDASGVLLEAQRMLREQGNWRMAAEYIEGKVQGFRELGARGRDPERMLRGRADEIWVQGEEEGERFVGERLAAAAALPVEPDAARVVEDRLRRDRALLLDRYVKSEYQSPVDRIDRVLGALGQARATIEESHFGKSLREEVERALRGAEFGAADALLASAEERIRADGLLQALLEEIPAPAARDFRGRVPRERQRVRELCRSWLEGEVARAGEAASRGRFAEALSILESAEGRSLPDLREPAAALRTALEEKRRRADEAVGAVVEGMLAAVLQEMGRRDFAAASRRLDEAAAASGPLGGDARVAEALAAARQLLEIVDRVAFGAALRDRLLGGDLPLGLQFEEGSRQLHPKVSRVRIRPGVPGPIVIFDAPNQPDLQGSLHRLSLPLVLTYAGLPGPGLTHEQALARGALLVLEGEGPSAPSTRDLSAAVSLLQGAAEGLPLLEPALRALVARAGETVAARALQQDRLEEMAGETLRAADEALQRKDPKEALRLLDLLLSKTLSTTRFAQDRRQHLLDLRRDAEAMLENLGLAAYFRGSRVTVGEPGPNRDSITRIEWSLDDEAQLRGFVPPEDGGPPLYRVFPDDAGPDGTPRGGRLAFLAPEPGPAGDGSARALRDSPLVIECPFKPGRYVAVSFTHFSEAPLYLQVSLLGNHVGVLTDDGRRESGRGVYAWQKEDWRSPDQEFPPEYRHDHVASIPDPAKFRDKRGQRYFQFEPGRASSVKVEWDQGHLRLFVDGREIWDAPLRDRNFRDSPPRLRIVTYTPCWIDDLAIEGVVDRNYWEKLSPGPNR
ncbi:MAG: serine/threonine protein kinase [Planctomycetes bacterium]|nr:serine/threonine protein kinase [Planctomycetota bacterium]